MPRASRFTEKMNGLIRLSAEKGATDVELAAALGVSTRTIQYWKADHPDFLRALEDGREACNDFVEASLFQRAVGYSQPITKAFYNAKLDKVVEHRMIERFPPDVAACIIWLKNRRPESWRDKMHHEVTGPDGQPLPPPALAVQVVVALPPNGREVPETVNVTTT